MVLLPHISKKQISIKDIQGLENFSKVSPAASLVLVKAARLYQEAIWIAEIDPSQAWILLVSAIESAAVFWNESHKTDVNPWEAIGKWSPDLRACLERANPTEEEIAIISSKITTYTGATSKFIAFIKAHFPSPPLNRPKEHWQHPWSKNKIIASIDTIYNYRSIALHSGRPFPMPMCQGIYVWKSGDLSYPEIPVEHSMSGSGGVWKREDVPMTLSLFEYIVRESLLKWWAEEYTITANHGQ